MQNEFIKMFMAVLFALLVVDFVNIISIDYNIYLGSLIFYSLIFSLIIYFIISERRIKKYGKEKRNSKKD